MADDLDRRLYEEVTAMRRRLDEISKLLEERLRASGNPVPAQPGAGGASVPAPRAGMADMLDLSSDFIRVITALVRLGPSTAEQIARELGEDELAVGIWLTTLVSEGQVSRQDGASGAAIYDRTVTRSQKKSEVPDEIWRRLEL